MQSGSVKDYLEYKSIQHASAGETKEEKDEVQDQRAGAQTTEYR